MDIETSRKFDAIAAAPYLGANYHELAQSAHYTQPQRDRIYDNWQTLVDDFAARTGASKSAIEKLGLPKELAIKFSGQGHVTWPKDHGNWPTFVRIADDSREETIRASHEGYYGQPIVFFGVARARDLQGDPNSRIDQVFFGLAADGTLASYQRKDLPHYLGDARSNFTVSAEVIGSIHDTDIAQKFTQALKPLTEGQYNEVNATRRFGAVRAAVSRARRLFN